MTSPSGVKVGAWLIGTACSRARHSLRNCSTSTRQLLITILWSSEHAGSLRTCQEHKSNMSSEPNFSSPLVRGCLPRQTWSYGCSCRPEPELRVRSRRADGGYRCACACRCCADGAGGDRGQEQGA